MRGRVIFLASAVLCLAAAAAATLASSPRLLTRFLVLRAPERISRGYPVPLLAAVTYHPPRVTEEVSLGSPARSGTADVYLELGPCSELWRAFGGIGGPSPRRILWLLWGSAALLLLGLLWIFSLRRGLRRQKATILRQIRERSGLERQLEEAQRLEAIGRLAGGLAHDFNNLLTIVGGRTAVMLQETPRPAWHDNLTEIQKAVERASGLTRQLLAYSRRQELRPVRLELGPVVHGLQAILRSLLGEGIELRLAAAADLWPIRADRGQLEQILMNLAVNARDAMPKGGHFLLGLENAPSLTEPGLAPGDYIRLSVADTGCGMSQEVQARIFEPFFTTKESGKGTGLGLSVVYGIVRQSGGFLRVRSVVGEGTTFELFFPRLRQEEDDAVRSDAAGAATSVPQPDPKA